MSPFWCFFSSFSDLQNPFSPFSDLQKSQPTGIFTRNLRGAGGARAKRRNRLQASGFEGCRSTAAFFSVVWLKLHNAIMIYIDILFFFFELFLSYLPPTWDGVLFQSIYFKIVRFCQADQSNLNRVLASAQKLQGQAMALKFDVCQVGENAPNRWLFGGISKDFWGFLLFFLRVFWSLSTCWGLITAPVQCFSNANMGC